MCPASGVDVLTTQSDPAISGGLKLALGVAVVAVAADQASKAWAVSALEPGPCDMVRCIDVIGSLRFHLHYNFGASFSLGQGWGPLFGLLAAAMAVLLLGAARRSPDLPTAGLYGLISGGAVGNLIDRAFRGDGGFLSGGVVDFIDLQWWPIFNIADAAIVCGIVLLLGHQWFGSPANTGNPANIESGA